MSELAGKSGGPQPPSACVVTTIRIHINKIIIQQVRKRKINYHDTSFVNIKANYSHDRICNSFNTPHTQSIINVPDEKTTEPRHWHTQLAKKVADN